MDLKEKIYQLKKLHNAVILAHNYQRGEVQDIADYVGDSLGLSRKASELDCKVIVFCGVKFMAETAKILSPKKTVLIPRMGATCPMADMISVEQLEKLKSEHPGAVVVSYVNTNADVKAITDVCCTSANAVKVVQNIKAKEIIFVPDKNLANYVRKFTDKKIISCMGHCYVHSKMTAEDVKSARESHKNAPIIVHPECENEVVELADEVLSTDGMLKFAKASKAKEIIIGTEEGIIHRLKKENPNKEFYTLGPARMCKNMKLTKLEDIYLALLAESDLNGKENQYRLELPDEIIRKASLSLTRMLEYV
ncbi:MAG: quinolinate synthase NadA [bacterium]